MSNQDRPFLEHLPALLTGAVLAVLIVIAFALVIIGAFLYFTAAIFWRAIS